MRKTNWRFLVDGLLFVTIVGLALIGFLLGFVLPEGPAASENSKVYLGLHRYQWGEIHLVLGMAFTVLAALHVLLGWSWVKGKARQLFQEKWRFALISVPALALVVLVLVWAFSPKYTELYENRERGVGGGGAFSVDSLRAFEEVEISVTGQMSLREIESQSGVSARAIAQRLGLPPDASLREPLGRLSRAHPFTLQDVRDVVDELMEERPKLGLVY